MRGITIASFLIIIIIFIFLWYRWSKCTNDCSSDSAVPCVKRNCSFWKGKPSSDIVTSENTSVAGNVDLLCEGGKYYKRTTTNTYGVADKVEITKAEFDALVAQGISYSGCVIGNNGNPTA